MKELITTIIIATVTAFLGWFFSKLQTKRERKKSDNDSLKNLQDSIDMLSDRNKSMLNELINMRGENAALKDQLNQMQIKIDVLTRENQHLQMALNNLIEKLKIN